MPPSAICEAPPPPPQLSETTGPALDDLFGFLPDIVATFNDEAITAEDVKGSIPAGLLGRLARGQTPDKKQLREVALSITQQLINEKILIHTSREAGFEPDEDAARRKVAAIKEKVGPEKFAAGLEHQGLTHDELCQRLARQMAVNRWIDETILNDIDTSEEALRKLYEEKRKQLQTPERVSVSHILIKTPAGDDDADAQADAKEKATAIREKIANGAEFAELARQTSDCASSKDGGKLGTIRRGETVTPFETVAFSLENGAVSDVIKTRYGYHILKVHRHFVSQPIPFEKAKLNLKQALQQEALHDALEEIITEGRHKAAIEVMIAQE